MKKKLYPALRQFDGACIKIWYYISQTTIVYYYVESQKIDNMFQSFLI